MNNRSRNFKRYKSVNTGTTRNCLEDEGNYREALQIHGIINNGDDSATDSDSGKSSLDEDYYKYLPDPIQIDEDKVVPISSEAITDSATVKSTNNGLQAQNVSCNEEQKTRKIEIHQQESFIESKTFTNKKFKTPPNEQQSATQSSSILKCKPETEKQKTLNLSATGVGNLTQMLKKSPTRDDKKPLLSSTAYEKTELSRANSSSKSETRGKTITNSNRRQVDQTESSKSAQKKLSVRSNTFSANTDNIRNRCDKYAQVNTSKTDNIENNVSSYTPTPQIAIIACNIGSTSTNVVPPTNQIIRPIPPANTSRYNFKQTNKETRLCASSDIPQHSSRSSGNERTSPDSAIHRFWRSFLCCFGCCY